MVTIPPHLYLRLGRGQGLDEELLRAALEQAGEVERQNLPAILTLGHLSFRTGIAHKYLRSVVERKIDPYRSFQIEKRGKKLRRHISVPQGLLMGLQRWILDRVLARVPTSPYSYAYTRGKSAKDCARRHCGCKWLIKMDLHNFFHSIDERRVYRVFAGLGYQPLVAFELSRLCTRTLGQYASRSAVNPGRYAIEPYYSKNLGFLPQGSPTSGAIANLSVRGLDRRLAEVARRRSLVYSRYADDLTFSSGDPFSRGAAVSAASEISQIVKEDRLRIHRKKTQIVPPGARKIVLGLLVDGDSPRMPGYVKSRIDEHIRGCGKFGILQHRESRAFRSTASFVLHFNGLLAYAYDIEPNWANKRLLEWAGILTDSGWKFASTGLPSIDERFEGSSIEDHPLGFSW